VISSESLRPHDTPTSIARSSSLAGPVGFRHATPLSGRGSGIGFVCVVRCCDGRSRRVGASQCSRSGEQGQEVPGGGPHP
jgi:hypothetical protein